MATHLRSFYESLTCCSTATHQSMCNDLLGRLVNPSTRPGTNKKTLADWFVRAYQKCAAFENINQPFLNEQSLKKRKDIGPKDGNDNRIIYLLSLRERVGVTGEVGDYCFQYVQRQVPPMRVEAGNQRTSGAGGIDYIGRKDTTPILGEVKVNSDQNPFYAFIQLLTYLSEMATPNQATRANNCQLFGVDIGNHPSFDLHILLADFNDRGEKGRLIEPTQRLATAFKARLESDFQAEASLLGKVLCLAMDSDRFADNVTGELKCLWSV